MTNPFDDLETDIDDEEPASHPEPVESVEPTEPAEQRTRETDDDDLSGPAFEYEEVRQRPLYARGETWDELEDELGITVTPELRRMGIRDEEKREIHDAVLKIALEHIDEIPNQIAAERRKE